MQRAVLWRPALRLSSALQQRATLRQVEKKPKASVLAEIEISFLDGPLGIGYKGRRACVCARVWGGCVEDREGACVRA